MPRLRGYTLYEMLVVISIIALLLSSGLPLLSVTISRRSLATSLIQLQALISSSLEEAMRRHSRLFICGASYNHDAHGDLTYLHSCASDNAWHAGVLAFVDTVGDGVYHSGERVFAFRFDQRVKVCISHSAYPDPVACAQGLNTDAKIVLEVTPQGTLTEAGLRQWYFTLVHSYFGQMVYAKYSLNSYGQWCNYRSIDGEVKAGC